MKKISLALTIGLLLSACGGGDSSPTPTATPAKPATNTSANQPVRPAQPSNTNNASTTNNNSSSTNTSNTSNSRPTTSSSTSTSTPSQPTTPTVTAPTNTNAGGRANVIHEISPIHSNMVAQPTSAEKMLMDAVIAETNAYRASKGLSPVQADDTLTAYGEIRAEEYSKRAPNSDPHARPNGASSVDNAYFKLSGDGGWAENLGSPAASISDVRARAKAMVQLWINSPTHEENLSNPQLTKIGIGVHQQGNQYYIAQIFASAKVEAKNYLGNQLLTSEQVRTGLNKVATIDNNQQLKLSGSASNRDYYGSSYRVDLGNDRQIIIKNESAWKNQTIGVVEEKDNPIAYVNVGQSHIPNDVNGVSGTYKGALLGDINGGDRLRADVTAVINGKNMTLQTANTHSVNPQVVANINAQGEMVHTDRKELNELNFSDTLTWNANSSQFESTSNPNLNHARFYGNSAQEIGGQFNRAVNQSYGKDRYGNDIEYKGTYRGAYGATKQ